MKRKTFWFAAFAVIGWAGLIGSGALIPRADAAEITATLSNLTIAESAVLNTGVYQVATNVGGTTSSTVNGVQFLGKAGTAQPWTATSNGITITSAAAGGAVNTSGKAGTLYDSVPALRDVMNSAITSAATSGSMVTVTMSGLVTGRDYRAQFLMGDQAGGSNRTMNVAPAGSNSWNPSGYNGTNFNAGPGTPRSLSAEFTADAASLQFNLIAAGTLANPRSIVNGVSVFWMADAAQGLFSANQSNTLSLDLGTLSPGQSGQATFSLQNALAYDVNQAGLTLVSFDETGDSSGLLSMDPTLTAVGFGVLGSGSTSGIYNVSFAGTETPGSYSASYTLRMSDQAGNLQNLNLTVSAIIPVPEPSTVALMVAGLSALAAWARGKRVASVMR